MSDCKCGGKVAIVQIAATDTNPDAMLVEIVLGDGSEHTFGDGADMMPLTDEMKTLATKIIELARKRNGND